MTKILAPKPPMGWNSWNTFAKNINETLIMEVADTMVEKGYRDAGYEYIIIDDCWSLKERQNGKLVADPELFPNGIRYLSDYVHSKGLKFGMYSCAGVHTCGGYPSSFGYEYEDAKQFAEWGIDYLKYDFCNFPSGGDAKTAYLKMAMALRNSGRDILFAACNWGYAESSGWMRSRGAHTYRSTPDIHDNTQSFVDIFKSQLECMENTGADFWNDMDMLTVGMHGSGYVGLGGSSDEEYLTHFAMWAFMGSPLIIGADVRSLDGASKETLLNKNLIAINQDSECRPPFVIHTPSNIYREHKKPLLAKIISGGRIAFAAFNIEEDKFFCDTLALSDLGFPLGSKVKVTDCLTDEVIGEFSDSFRICVEPLRCKVYIGELVK